MTLTHRLLIRFVFRNRMNEAIYVLRISTLNNFVRISLCSVAVRATIRRRETLRIRLITCLRRSRVATIRNFLRNNGNVHTVFCFRCNRTSTIIHRTLISTRFVGRETSRYRISILLVVLSDCCNDRFFCSSAGRVFCFCLISLLFEVRECYVD